MKHIIHSELVTRAVRILLVGAGGNGSRMLERLVALHRAMLAKGHPAGLEVTVVDGDTVSQANIGRQAFYPGDVGTYKAHVLVNRANMALQGVIWSAVAAYVTESTSMEDYDLVIGAVDNRNARRIILRQLKACRWDSRYWLDLGNRRDDGQIILGEVDGRNKGSSSAMRLPHVGELYPEMVDPTKEEADDTPSCSLQEALEKQSLFINPTVADFAANLLFQLFTQGGLDVHGIFVNLKGNMVTPLRVDLRTWARFGVSREKPSDPPAQELDVEELTCTA